MNTVWKIIRGSEYSLRAGALALWDWGLPRLPRRGGVCWRLKIFGLAQIDCYVRLA
jgi:hypothetical protein